MAKAKYNSPFSVGKRQTLYLDADDPRVTGFEAGISASRAGAEIVVLNPGNAGLLVGSAASASPKRYPSSSSNPKASEGKTPTDITNLSAQWQTIENKPALVFSFNIDLTAPDNDDIDAFLFTLSTSFATTPTISYVKLNTTSVSQEIIFYYSDNIKYFGGFKTSFTQFKVKARDKGGNVGPEATLSSIPIYSNSLPAPVITVSAIPRGYSVDWNTIAEEYEYISIEEVISSAATAPVTGYQQIYLSDIKPAVIITPTTETRWVKARFTDGAGTYGAYSIAHKITPEGLVTADITGPDNVTSVTSTSGIDTSGYLGFNAYADISWPAVTGGGIRGYRIRFSNDNGTTYSYVDSPGTGTTYRLGGLAIGATYKIAVATYDEFNNLSSSFVSGSDVTVAGTPSVSNYIAGGPFQFGVGVGGVSTNKGLYFDASNYWYVNATNSARLKVGGSTSNYLEWNGSTFAVDGNITARQGSFAGNVSIITGGSLIAGTVGSSSVIVNSDGLSANNSGGSALTEIVTSPITFGNTPKGNSTGGTSGSPLPFPINFFTQGAMIGGWVVGSSVITDRSQQFTLDSTNKKISITGQTSTLSNYRVNLGTALYNSISNTINVIEAGTIGFEPNFYVTENGVLHANGAVIQGKIETGLSSGGAQMQFGAGVGVGGKDGLHINAANYWYSDATFSIGGGIISGNHSSLTINGGSVTLQAIGTVESDNNNFAGDPTLTLNSSNNIVKGRRFIFNGSSVPSSNVVLSGGVGSWTTGGGTTTSVKVGDILMVS